MGDKTLTKKRWSICTVLLTVVLLAGVGGFTALVDPFFHYHAPLEGLSYEISEQRYQNDGIVRHFDYDAIITGTSMTHHFKTSEFDALFDVHSVKVPFAGSGFKEVNDNLRRALEANQNVRYIIRCLDIFALFDEKDSINEDYEYPTYLYDDCLFNDVSYLLNGEVLINKTINTIQKTLRGEETTSFDDYSCWTEEWMYNEEALRASYTRGPKVDFEVELTPEQWDISRANWEQNLISLAKEHPDIQFYYFLPPYSIFFWDFASQMGTLHLVMDVLREITVKLIEYGNIHLFSFFDEFELIGDLDIYMDAMHYHPDVNSQILQWMAAGEHRLTEENYQEHWDTLEAYLTDYPFDSLFAQ